MAVVHRGMTGSVVGIKMDLLKSDKFLKLDRVMLLKMYQREIQGCY